MQWMAGRGIASYAIDFRGHGRSAGKPNAINRWDDYLDDLTRFLAIEELAATGTPLFILGHSHGGLVAAAAPMRG
jgi:lysophospholipase